MKHITEYLNESLVTESAEINSEKEFREYAEKKFKDTFGDELDEDKMNKTIDGILKDYKKDAENGDWGKLVGVLNKGF